MSPDTPRSSLFKSRFSILSLLPSRHPPLHVSHPMPQRYDVQSRHPTIVSSTVSPVHSEYPDPSTPLPPSKPKRPPPLDLKRTRMMYPPNHNDVIIDPETATAKTEHPASIPILHNAPPLPPKRELSEKLKPKAKGAKKVVKDDPFEVAEVEIGHRYPSWKGGKVDLKPGQVIPRDMIPSLVSHGSESPKRKTRDEVEELDNYESVLHNVLLTPTYLRASPLPPRTNTPSSLGESSRYAKRRTLLDRAGDTISGVARTARNSRWLPGKSILKPSYALEADRSLRAMKDREEQEMERFRRNVKPVRLNVPDYEDDDTSQQRYPKSREGAGGGPTSTWSISSSSSPVRENSGTYKRSPGWVGAREWAAGGGSYEGQRARMPERADEGSWRANKAEEVKQKMRQRVWKYGIAIAILILAALIIGLCTTLLRKDSKSSSSSSSSNSTDTSSITATSSAAIPTPTSSETLTSCLDQFRVLPNPSSYPCSDCVPILQSVTNDFSQPMVNGNATGVGSALQFCAVRDIHAKTASKDGMANWMKDSSPCGGWNGVSCDSRGRITGLLLQYPNVPDELPESIGNIWALEAIHIMGNGSVPTGKFPSNLLSSSNLKTIDLEYTALSGPIDQAPFSSAKSLTTLVLVNNPNMGNTLPDLSGNTGLLTLAVTAQGLVDAKTDKLPSGITYLDLSFNSLSGIIPNFSQLSNLNTLYLQNNKYTTSPSTLPSSIVSLSLTSNTDLSGSLPASVCSSSILENCDLRLTKLSGTIASSNSNSASLSSSASSSASPTSSPTGASSSSSSAGTAVQPVTTAASSAALASTGQSASTSAISTNGLGSGVSIVGREPASCGVCKFT
ncbi:hypothetical protein I302_108414 [Kwoniella bestiolae CBS 10118]|uniref:Leucine-rich repeat-containing N-terminal plant-type domain-containing protein n=1 Tax=Kwoniella bestiolae CBS 10118 TaxID=1296100 RepID=A0A1B9FVS5_9TREE|nr:hypothetical protein I302_07211 [Kwoniella bestiolae CBS 10118]OCF22865.1 hypothetical protein I302_07211 [Kwoniella bestiolae CBS 10118]